MAGDFQVFKLALVQMAVEGGNKEKNLSHARELIRQAAEGSADIALLPEAMDLGWTDPSAIHKADPIPDGETSQALSHAARENGIYVCAGLVEKSSDRVFNTAVLLSRTGETLLLHRKLNELEIGHDYYAQGDRLNVCRTELGTLGLMICADGFARDRMLSRALCYMGADIILSPGSWAVNADHDQTKDPYGKVWRDSYIPVAREFEVWIAGVSNVGWISGGPWKGKKCIGCSLVIDPEGREVLEGPYGPDAEAILYTDVEIVKRPARGEGWPVYWKKRRGNRE